MNAFEWSKIEYAYKYTHRNVCVSCFKEIISSADKEENTKKKKIKVKINTYKMTQSFTP